MFKRFHNHVEGAGIGLYIIKRIIDNAGGRVEVESKEGEGTAFKVYFKA
jgi:signal transduction histidine kinase